MGEDKALSKLTGLDHRTPKTPKPQKRKDSNLYPSEQNRLANLRSSPSAAFSPLQKALGRYDPRDILKNKKQEMIEESGTLDERWGMARESCLPWPIYLLHFPWKTKSDCICPGT